MSRRNIIAELIEPRRLLAVVSFDNSAGTYGWNNPLNWSNDVLPQAGDDVTIAIAAPSMAGIAANVSVALRSFTVSTRIVLTAAISVDVALRVTSGGNVRFPSGSVSGAGTLTIEAGGTWAPELTSSSPVSGSLALARVDNYGSFAFSAGRVGGTFYNYATANAYEGGNYYGAIVNESGATLGIRYLPNQPGGTAVFGLALDAAGTTTLAAPFVNHGLIYNPGLGGGTTGTGLSNFMGQSMAVDLDATPTLGGQWQFAGGPLTFGTFNAATAATVTLEPTFSLLAGTLRIQHLNLAARGLAEGTGLRVDDLDGAASTVTLVTPRTSIQLLQVITGTLRLGTGGRVVRAPDVGITSAARLDLGDGLLIDANVPYYGTAPFVFPPPTNPPPPAPLPAYAESLRATVGADTLTVRVGNGASTRTDEGIAYALGAGLLERYPAGTFLGETFDANDFVFRATRRGDADLDRDVDFSDLLVTAQHYGGPTTGRGVPDGNFDDPANLVGTVNFDDLLLLSQSYGRTFLAELPVMPPPATPARRRANAAWFDV